MFYRMFRPFVVTGYLLVLSVSVLAQKSTTDSLFRYFIRINDTQQTDTAKSIYLGLLNQFPEEQYKSYHYIYDMCRAAVAIHMIKSNDAGTMDMIAAVKGQQIRRNYLGGFSNRLQENGKGADAEALLLKEFEKAKVNGVINDSSSYFIFSVNYAELLLKMKRYTEGLSWMEAANGAGYVKTNYQRNKYAQLLLANKQSDKALSLLTSMAKKGQTDEEARRILKEVWMASGNSKNSYAAFEKSVSDTLRNKMTKSILEKAVNYQAPDFELIDLKGKKVSLKSLRGKVVFIDFWATWCGPCVGSFPVLQAAADKYKGKVVFLFINSWEPQTDATKREALVKNFITGKKYRFNVLLDRRTGPENNDYDVISQYKVKGIPAKFIIDKTGNVRYAFSGFSGDFDASLMEIDLLLESLL